MEEPVWLGRALGAVAAWGCVVRLLGFASRYLRDGGRKLSHGARPGEPPAFVYRG